MPEASCHPDPCFPGSRRAGSVMGTLDGGDLKQSDLQCRGDMQTTHYFKSLYFEKFKGKYDGSRYLK